MHAGLHFRPIVSFLTDPPERLKVTDREAALPKIAVGDIFHASFRGRTDGPSYPCLALRVREDAIFARRMTTQSVHWFDRTTGAEIDDDRVVIDSVEPPEQRRAILFIAKFYAAHPLPPRQ